MVILGRGELVDPSNPKLVFWAQLGGRATDVEVLEFQVFDTRNPDLMPVQVFPVVPGTWAPVDVTTLSPARLDVGRYAATWQVPGGQPAGQYLVRWRWRWTLDTEPVVASQPLDVMDLPLFGQAGPYYVLPSTLRREGVSATGPRAVTDSRLLTAIRLASLFVERATRRWFEPRALNVALDGNGSGSLALPHPVIALDELGYAGDHDSVSTSLLSIDAFRVYNRHLSGLDAPDDRAAPRVDLYVYDGHQGRYPRGRQNVRVAGWFGYTEYDGTPWGRTPELLSYAVSLLTLRYTDKLVGSGRAAGRDAWRITAESTREQSITYGAASTTRFTAAADLTGDPELDALINAFRAPPRMGAV